MAATATKIYEGTRSSSGLRRRYVVDVFVVEGAGTIDEQAAYTATGIPPVGTPARFAGAGGIYAGAICVDRLITEWLDPSTCLMAVVYDSANRWGGGPRAISDTITEPLRDFTIPIIRKRTMRVDGPGDPTAEVYVLENKPFPRSRFIRIEARFLTGDETAIQNAIANNFGLLYTIGGRTYQFLGGRATSTGTGYIRVLYKFEITSPFAAIPANSSFLRNDVAIPALPPGANYVVNMEAYPPTITAAGADVFFGMGGPLPGL